MALDRKISKAGGPCTCADCGRGIPRGDAYWLVPKPTKAPAAVYCVTCYTALPPYFKHTRAGL